MSIKGTIKRVIGPFIGALFAVVCLFTSVFGNYIITLMLPMITILNKHEKWRDLIDRAASFWIMIPLVSLHYFTIIWIFKYFQFFLRFIFGIKVRASGDEIIYGQPGIVIMNHRTRLDWMYYWMVLWRMNPWLCTTNKIALKEFLRHCPGVGRLLLCFWRKLSGNIPIDKEHFY